MTRAPMVVLESFGWPICRTSSDGAFDGAAACNIRFGLARMDEVCASPKTICWQFRGIHQ